MYDHDLRRDNRSHESWLKNKNETLNMILSHFLRLSQGFATIAAAVIPFAFT